MFDRAAYTRWLQQLRAVCTERRIALIFDEIFVGFRLALGGAQEYFGVAADLVTYGKTLGGGLPVGVLCGRHEWMKRYRDDRPVDICLARGTFNAHPYVMGAMNEFLHRLETPEMLQLYQDLDELLERTGRAAQPSARRGGVAGQGGQSLVDLDGVLYTPVPLQLDVAILSACRRTGAELGRHRSPDLQPEVQRCGFRRCRGPVPGGGEGDGGGRLVVDGSPPAATESIRRQILREMLASYAARFGGRLRAGMTGAR